MLLWFDQPAAYATASVLQRWTDQAFGSSPTVQTASQPRAGSAYLQVTNQNNWFTKTLGSDGGPVPSGARAILGVRYRAVGFPFVFLQVLQAGSAQVSVGVNADGTISVRRGSATGTVLGTTTYALTTSTWYFIELNVLIDDTVGTVDLSVDGVNKLSLTGQDTKNTASATWNGFGGGDVVGNPSANTAQWTDWYVCDGVDGTTASPAQQSAFNTMLGDRKVEWLLTSAGNGSNTGWTLSTGADHGAVVDDAAPNSDTDYAYATTSGVKDTNNLSNLPSTAVNIDAVAPLLSASKDDAGAKQVKPVLRIGSTDYLGTAIEAPSVGTYRYLTEIMTKSPATSISFTPTEVNALELGFAIP